MSVTDSDFFIDATTQLPREGQDTDNKYDFDLSIPYRRAMALDIFRIVAEEPGFLIEAFKLNGSETKLERETLKRKHDPNDTVGLLEKAVKNVDELWAKYDVDGSGTVDFDELTQLLDGSSPRMTATIQASWRSMSCSSFSRAQKGTTTSAQSRAR